MKKYLIFSLAFLILLTGCDFNYKVKIDTSSKEDDEIVEEEEKIEEKVEHQGKKSSKDEPLKINEVGLASKYSVKEEKYDDVDVKVVENKKIDFDNEDVKKYIEKENVEIESKSGYKLIMTTIDVTLVDFKTESFGSDVEVNTEILDEKSNPIVVNGVKQFIDAYAIDKGNGKFEGETGTLKIVYQIPNDVNSYMIKLGAVGNTQAYIKLSL